MVTVGLKNFRTYTENPEDPEGFFRFKFEPGINLLRGVSGVGKSTIFHAISWCLFKKPANGNSPLFKSSAKSPTTVSIQLENTTITRVTPGSMLTVSLGDVVMEGEEAQAHIYGIYGGEDMWKTCNYIQQGYTNPFMSGELSDSQRWDVLYSLALGPDTGGTTIEKIKNILRVRLDALSRAHISGTGELTAITSFHQSEKEKLKIIDEELATLGGSSPGPGILEDLRRAEALPPTTCMVQLKLKRADIEDRITTTTSQLRTLEHRLREVDEERDSKTRDLRRDYEKCEKHCKTLRDKIQTAETLARKRSWVGGILKSICNSDPLEKFVDTIQCQSFADLQGRVCKLVGGIVWLASTLKTYSMEELTSPPDVILSALREAEKSKYPITCPGCKDHLVVSFDRGGKIACTLGHEKASGNPPSYYQTLLSHSERWSRESPSFRDLLCKFKESPVRAEKLAEFSSIPPSTITLDALRAEPEDLGRIEETLAESEIELVSIRDRLGGINTLCDQTSREVTGEIRKLDRTRASLEADLVGVNKEIRDGEYTEQVWQRLDKHNITKSDNIREKIRALERISYLHQQKEPVAARLLELEEKRLSTEKTLGKTTEDMVTARKLLEKIMEVESDVLIGSISQIEGAANEFLENCFDYPLTLKLGTERESKSTKTKKHTFTINVVTGKTDGALVARSLEGFSGGERDRISLSLTMAITNFSQFPLLLLDECISSLSSDLKDITIRALRQHAKNTNKTIILVCHDAVDGLFDNVCDLEKV